MPRPALRVASVTSAVTGAAHSLSVTEGVREAIGPVGAYSFALDKMSTTESTAVARRIEQLGFASLWIAEGAASREALSHAAVLLNATSSLMIGTGIASIWARDPTAMASGWRTLSDAYPRRFVLGIGVSHSGAVGRRGHEYSDKPLSTMRAYLDEMDSATLLSPIPTQGQTRVLAALRPRMLELAAERTDGAHTYFVPPQHTSRARSLLGSEPLLVVQQAVVLEEDPRCRPRSRPSPHVPLSGTRQLPEQPSFPRHERVGPGRRR
jgi:probable F420-dependent oxidoreductase